MEEVKLKISNAFKHISKTPEIKNSRFSNDDKRKIADASKDFESMLTGMMLKSMTSSVEGFFGGEGYGGDMFDTIFTSSLSSHFTESGSFGIAQQIYKKVTGEDWDNSILEMNKKIKAADFNNKMNIQAKPVDTNTTGTTGITPSKSSLKRVEKYEKIIEQMSEKFNIDSKLIKSVILAESAGNANAVSKAKAKGLMQLMDKTAEEMGVNNSFDPTKNIYGGAKYLSHLLRQYSGDVKLALAAYNAGPGNVEKFDGIPPFSETKNYLNRVLGYYNYLSG